jgi:hypothetical protein
VLRAGQEYEHKSIKVQIREVIPYFDPAGRKTLLVSYRIKDGDFESQTAHFFMRAKDDPRPKIEEVVETYLELSKIVRTGSP